MHKNLFREEFLFSLPLDVIREMFSVIVCHRKSDMENRQAIRPEQRKLFPSDYFSRNFSLMIISLNGRIFTPEFLVLCKSTRNQGFSFDIGILTEGQQTENISLTEAKF